MKINLKVVVLAIILTMLIYPKTIELLIKAGQDVYTARKLSIYNAAAAKAPPNAKKIKLVFIFDDGWESVYSEAYPLMKKYGYQASVSVIPEMVDNKEYMSYHQLAELYMRGWDLLNHSYSHKEGIYNHPDKLIADFKRARRWMRNRQMGGCSDMLIIPYGDVNPYMIKQAKSAGFRNIRTSDNVILLDEYETEYYTVKTINLLTDVTVKEVIDLSTQTSDESNAILFILHKIRDGKDESGMAFSKKKLAQILMFFDEHSDRYQVITYSQLFK